MIAFENVHKRFGDREVLRGVDLTLGTGQVAFVLGRSGAGKSVLSKMVVGLLHADTGRIDVDGTDVTRLTEAQFTPIRRRCQYVFQAATLFDSLTVLENVALPIRKHARCCPDEAEARARTALKALYVEALAPRLPGELGRGQLKRVAIARAMGLQPEVILFDEPTTGLDPVAARRVDALIRSVADRGVTCMVVSHDLTSVAGIADAVAFLHEGRVVYEGCPTTFLASDAPVLAAFRGPAKAAG